MSGPVSLDDLYGAYRRTASRIYRILEDGYDFAIENLIIEKLNRDALIIDTAFFLLVFGQIELRLNELATARLQSEAERAALRQRSFGRRLAMALPGPANRELREDIAAWSTIRNDAAHGRELTEGYAMPAIFERAYQLDTLLSGRLADPAKSGEGTL